MKDWWPTVTGLPIQNLAYVLVFADIYTNEWILKSSENHFVLNNFPSLPLEYICISSNLSVGLAGENYLSYKFCKILLHPLQRSSDKLCSYSTAVSLLDLCLLMSVNLPSDRCLLVFLCMYVSESKMKKQRIKCILDIILPTLALHCISHIGHWISFVPIYAVIASFCQGLICWHVLPCLGFIFSEFINSV